ncbi:MAG: BBP7 family outer membrane beta-barrel protein [Gemmataceae bacterium]
MGARAWIAWTVAMALASPCLAQDARPADDVLEFRSVTPPPKVQPAAPVQRIPTIQTIQPTRTFANAMPTIQVGRPQPLPRFATEESQDEPGQPPRPAPITPPSLPGETLRTSTGSIPQAPINTPILVESTPPLAEWASTLNRPIAAADPFWVKAEYWVGWVEGMQLPALVTTASPGTPRAFAGLLGNPNTDFVVAGSAANGARNGVKFDTGFWFPRNDQLGVEFGGSMLESQSSIYAIRSDGTKILARPFFDVTSNSQQAVLVAFPGVSGGRIDVTASSGNFYEGHLDLIERTIDTGTFRADSIIGYRFYRYDERVVIQQTAMPQEAAFIPGTVIQSFDDFRTRNEFHGIDMGVRFRFLLSDDWSLGLLAKVALGRQVRESNVSGGQQSFVPGQTASIQQGGVLALTSNIGTRSKSDWSVLPELGVNLGYQVTTNMKLTFGYSLLLMQGISRASDQIDINVNPGLLPPSTLSNPAFPAPLLRRDDVWIQSLNLGLEFVF